jgi:hypothetical protein
MKNVTTYVIDAHKKDLCVAMLTGNEPKPLTWQLANQPNAVRRLVRKLKGEAPGPVRVFRAVWLCLAMASDDDVADSRATWSRRR